MNERAWQIGLMTNFLDCYSGIDWPSVFDGTYDAEHPEGRWFDPVKIWTRSYWEFTNRPVDPTVGRRIG